jgi:hypothetical protein
MNKHIILKLAVIFISVAAFCCSAEQIKGTVYGDSSGPSGTGTGEVRIATQQCILDLSYQKPFPRNFLGAACDDIGAYWAVEGRITHPGIGELNSARCDGKYDFTIRSAWLVAREFLRLASLHLYDEANQLLVAPAVKSKQTDASVKLAGC